MERKGMALAVPIRMLFISLRFLDRIAIKEAQGLVE
jgi:hypothetical protein